MALYKPPTRVATLQIPYAALVSQADPDWAPGKHRELAYVFSGRFFFYDPYHSGPYSPPFATDFSPQDFDAGSFNV